MGRKKKSLLKQRCKKKKKSFCHTLHELAPVFEAIFDRLEQKNIHFEK